MDEQQDPYSIAPPPQPHPQPYGHPYGEAYGGPPAPAPKQHPFRRTAGIIASTALVAGLVGAGAGYATGHGFGGAGDATQASGSQQQASGGSGSSGGLQDIPGNPGWQWSGGGQQGGVPSDPFNGGGDGQGAPGQGGSSSDSSTKASGSQLTGLVRVVSTMKYAGAKAAGTGMVLTSDGEIVTNHHVVEGATAVKVTVMSTGKSYTASVVGTDAKDDVAVLQLTSASGLQTVKTDTGSVKVGDKVTAVGDGNGTVSYLSAASGKVMALKQSITTQSEGTATGERLTGLTKISSDVVSGYSGGATYDSQGDVIGMTTAASSGTSDVVGYAVPISKVLTVADDLENNVAAAKYDYGRPAFLGVGLGQSGTTVQGVYQGTPAAKAGIVAGDRITAIDGTAVSDATKLHDLVAAHSPGESVSVTWAGNAGQSHTATVTLVQGPVA